MKLKSAFLVCFIAFFYTAVAQDVQFGVTAALTFNNLSGNGMSSKSQAGFEGGGFATIPLTRDFSLQPEIVYNISKVNRSDDFSVYYVDDSRPDSRSSFNVGYITIPLLINYHASPKVTINAGPQFGILTYSNEDLLYNKQAIKNTDFGIRGGFQFNVTPTFNLFASYYYGLQDVNNIDNRYAWKSRQFQLGVNIPLFSPKKP